MELRDIEIYLALAEELHFGRTAERLHVSQARVSQAIKKQERRIGGALFERTSRNVTLTPLGEQLRDDLRTGYDAIRAGLAKATSTARGVTGTLRVGAMGTVCHLLRDLIDRFLSCNPGCDVEIREIHHSDPFGPLRESEADVVVLWRPVREPDLTEGPVVVIEGRALAVWSDHGLASQPSVSLEDLADQITLNRASLLPGYWGEAMLPARTPRGRQIQRRGPNASTFHEVLTLVAARKCITPVAEHAIRYYSAHPGVVFVPIRDAPATEWALVWRAAGQTPLIGAFAQTAREIGRPTLERLTGALRMDTDGGNLEEDSGGAT